MARVRPRLEALTVQTAESQMDQRQEGNGLAFHFLRSIWVTFLSELSAAGKGKAGLQAHRAASAPGCK